MHLDDGRVLEIKVENDGKQEEDANHDPCEDNYIADEDVKGVDENPGINGNLKLFSHQVLFNWQCKLVRKIAANESRNARKRGLRKLTW